MKNFYLPRNPDLSILNEKILFLNEKNRVTHQTTNDVEFIQSIEWIPKNECYDIRAQKGLTRNVYR